MYGDKFGKSLCHAWAASPIYLLGKYFVGVRNMDPGGERYEAKPHMEFLHTLDCILPVGEHRMLRLLGDGEEIKIKEMRHGV